MTNPTSRPLRVFLCHSSGDKPIVRELYQKLTSEGWIDVWLDEEKLLPGMDWNLEIEKAVEDADVTIVCLSSNSVTKEGYVQRELKYALDIALEKPEGTIFVIPLRLDNCKPPRRLRGWQYADYFPEGLRPRAYQRMLESLKVRARLLILSPSTPEKTSTPDQISPIFPTKQVSPAVTTHLSGGTKLSSRIAQLGVAIKRISIWKYARLLVLFLLVLGSSGRWGTIFYNSYTGFEAYILLARDITPFTLIPLEFGALFLLTLARLLPWRFKGNTIVAYLERLVAGFGTLTAAFFLAVLNFLPSDLPWGILLTVIGICLATINILLEMRSSLQKRAIWPWWAWLLAISAMLPWLVLLRNFLLSK